MPPTARWKAKALSANSPLSKRAKATSMYPDATSTPEIGKMYGTYMMERMIDKKKFYVRIPNSAWLCRIN
jgi:hypothetical protein